MAKDAFVSLKAEKKDPADAEYFRKPEDQPDFYPVTIYLDKPQVDALGCASCNVGDMLTLIAHCKVTSKSATENEGGDDYGNIRLTIIEAKIEDENGKGVDMAKAAKNLYGKEGDAS